MSHYFTTDNTDHDFNEIEFDFSGHTFKFKTDRGVFSRARVDYGTEVLLKGILEEKSALQLEGRKLIDMGAGYGPVGIVLSHFFRAQAFMIEVNEDALDLLETNLVQNNAQGEVMSRERYDQLQNFEVDLYVTNPPFRAGKKVVLEMIDDAYRRLSSGGAFFMVVQKKQGMPSYKQTIEKVFGSVEVVLKDKGYYVLKGRK